MFDCALHGYDPVACDEQTTVHGEQEESAVEFNVAPLSDPETVDVVLYYPDDLFEEDFEEFADRRGDLFTWIKIVVGKNLEPDYPFMEYECA